MKDGELKAQLSQTENKTTDELEDQPPQTEDNANKLAKISDTDNITNYTNQNLKNKKKSKSKKGPTFLIITVVLSFFGITVGSQAMFPVAFLNRVSSEFNSIFPSNNVRDRIAAKALIKNGSYEDIDPNKNSNIIKKNIFNKERFKISKKQAKKLASAGIKYDKSSKSLIFNGKSIKAEQLDDFFDNNPEFRTKYLSATQTWRGKISGWFDTTIKKVLNRIGLSNLRNIFKNYQNTGDKKADVESYRTKASNRPSSIATISESENEIEYEKEKDKNGKLVTKKDANGNPIPKRDKKDLPIVKKDNNGKPIKNNLAENSFTPDDPDLKSKLKDHFHSAVNKAGTIANVACGLMIGANAIQMIASANQSMETIKLISGFLESVEKVKAGEGDKSPLNHYMSDLTTPDKNGKTAIGSYGIMALFGAGGRNFSSSEGNSDPRNSDSFLKSNTEFVFSAMPIIPSGINMLETLRDCRRAKAALAAANIAIDLISVASAAFTAGVSIAIGNAIKMIWSFTKKAVVTVTISLAVKVALEKAIGYIADVLTQNLISNLGYLGEVGGNYMGSGANAYPGQNAKGGGQTSGSTKKIAQYQSQILAKHVEIERDYEVATKSPFDISSPHTFLGSIYHNLALISVQKTNIFANLGLISRSSLKFISDILPSANAIAETKILTTEGHCPILSSVGVTGDPFCNPYYFTDNTTITIEPEQIFFDTYLAQAKLKTDPTTGNKYFQSTNFLYEQKPEIISINSNSRGKVNINQPALDQSGNPKINPHSKLGGYIRFCANRSSKLGTDDANIMSWVKDTDFENGTFNGVINSAGNSTVLGIIPLLGDGLDLASYFGEEANYKWATGQVCVANPETNPEWESEFKYYQRFMEDQRYLENAGVIERSSADLVMDQQLAWEPLDQSYEGVLARYSGMTKPQVVATLNYVKYLNYIANYNPKAQPLPTNYPQPAITKINKPTPFNLSHWNNTAKNILPPIPSLTKKTKHAIIG